MRQTPSGVAPTVPPSKNRDPVQPASLALPPAAQRGPPAHGRASCEVGSRVFCCLCVCGAAAPVPQRIRLPRPGQSTHVRRPRRQPSPHGRAVRAQPRGWERGLRRASPGGDRHPRPAAPRPREGPSSSTPTVAARGTPCCRERRTRWQTGPRCGARPPQVARGWRPRWRPRPRPLASRGRPAWRSREDDGECV